MLQILRKNASDFTPAGGSNISLDGDHLKCDDYIVGSQTLFCNAGWRSICMRSDGDFRLNGYYTTKFVKMPSTLDSYTHVDLSDGDSYQKTGMCLDDENNIYFACWISPGHLKKYNDSGTLQWTYTGAGSTPGTFSWAGGVFYYDNRIFVTSPYNYYIFILDKDGNFISEILSNAGGSTLVRPRSIWVDSTGIYIQGEYGFISKWNVSDYSFVENLPPIPFGFLAGQGASIRRLSGGDFVVCVNTDYRYDSISYWLLAGDMSIKRKLLGASDDPLNETSKGLIRFSQNGMTPTLIDEANKYMYVATFTAVANTVNLLKMNMRNATERFATLQHNFGSPVNIKRLNINALYDNRDESWKSMRLWYQIDGGGYVEVDMKDPLLDINGQVLDLRVGMTSYGFLRHWPEFYSIDILYDDGQSPSYEYPLKGEVTVDYELEGIVDEN